ncbi:hypothetical protein Syun_031938 [Stephania yunnanensis]|uniref:Uncharacterized protein n=1 Tax=Stephania yunnanensis TaxID=152371 RepID=A0AAP0E192_9MAGN
MSTPWSVFQDGRMGSPQPTPRARSTGGTPNGARFSPRSQRTTSPRHNNNPALAAAAIRVVHTPSRSATASSPFRIRPRRIAAPIRFPPDNFKHSLTLFSKSFSSFPRALVRYLTLAAFSLDEFTARSGPHSQTTRLDDSLLVVRQGPSTTGGLSPSLGAPFQGT